MTRGMRRLFILIGILALIGLAIFLVWWFAFRDTSTLRVVALPPLSGRSVDDYRNSHLRLDRSGVFHIEIIFTENDEDTVIFAGHGRWQRSGNVIYLYFIDATEDSFIGENKPFDRHRRGILFIDHNHHRFYFN